MVEVKVKNVSGGSIVIEGVNVPTGHAVFTDYSPQVQQLETNGDVSVSLTTDSSETYSEVTIMSITTPLVGTNYQAFSSQVCTSLDIFNNSTVTIEYRRNGAGLAMPIPANGSRLIQGITNANQISVRRNDTSNTQVTVYAEAFQV